MAWSEIPSSTSKLNTWEFLRQFPRALIERGWAAGSQYYPRCSHAWYEGTITSMTETVMTDSAVTTWDNTKNNPWLGVDLGPDTIDQLSLPLSWTLVIDSSEPDEVIITDITAIGTTTLTVESIRDYITSKFANISAASDLVGRKYAIIRGDYGLWWSQRLMQTPNSYEFAEGDIATLAEDGDLPASPKLTLIRDTTKSWAINELAGKDILFYAVDGFLKRKSVVSNTETTVYFAPSDSLPDTTSEYIVISTTGKGYPGREKPEFSWWYSGYQEGYQSHNSSDELASVNMPETFKHVDGADDSFGCGGYEAEVWDADVWTEYPLSPADADCGGSAEEPQSPDIWKTIRGWQLMAENLSSSFIEEKDYEDELYMPLMNPAMMFRKAGINSYDSEVTSLGTGTSDNTVNITSIAIPFYPVNCYWAVLDKRGDVRSYGTGIMNSQTQLTAYTSSVDVFHDPASDPTDTTDVGKTIYISLGWSRFVERQFKYMYPRTGFVPDYTCDIFDNCGATIPPATDFGTTGCDGVGQWVRRAASTNYIDRTITSGSWAHTAQGFAEEDEDAFADGELARYVGDNFTDPCVRTLGDSVSQASAASNPQLQYFDYFYVGHHPKVTENHIISQRKGTATKQCGSFWITDSSKHFWNELWKGSNSPAHTESGTATSGSTTSLTDSTKASGEPNCWWATSRFNGFSSTYTGFTVEILISGTFDTPTAIVEKRIITSGTSSGTLNWSQALSTSASGKSYRIREPAYELNKWEGRSIKITATNGTEYVTTVVGNDDNTIFFTDIGVTVELGWTYKVVEPTVGDVFLRSSGSWTTVPVGDDVVRVGVTSPNDFHKTQNQNLPTLVKRFGKLFIGDRIVLETFSELYTAINTLRWTRATVNWDNPDSLDNYREGVENDTDSQYDSWNNFWTTGTTILVGEPGERHYQGVQEAWDLGSATFNSASFVPYAQAIGDNQASSVKTGGYYKQTNLARISVPLQQYGLLSRVAYYVYSTINSGDTDEGGVCTTEEVDLGVFVHSYQQYKFNGNISGENTKYRAMHLWDEEASPSGDLTRYSVLLGSDIDTEPPIPDDPALSASGCLTGPSDYYSATQEGWYAYVAYAAIQWDVTGGLSYID